MVAPGSGSVTDARGRGVTILTAHYAPETGAAARRLTALAGQLVKRGHRVRVVTTLPHHPAGIVHEGFERPTPDVRVEEGVEVVRLRPWIVPRERLAWRLASEAWFALRAFASVLRSRGDLVLASSPYMFLGPAGWIGARLSGSAFVWDVRDLTWRYPAAAGKRTFGLDRLLEFVMRRVARHADAVVAVDGAVAAGVPTRGRSAIIPNGVDRGLLERFDVAEARTSRDGNRQVVLYAGLLGHNHGLDTVVRAASHLDEAELVIAGDGAERPRLERIVREEGIGNVRFLGHVDTDALLELYREADLLVSHLRRSPVHTTSIPAKLWEYMATGVPFVHAGEGAATELVEGQGLGYVGPPEDPTALARALAEVLASPSEARDRAQRARSWLREHRLRDALNERYAELLDDVIADRRRPAGETA